MPPQNPPSCIATIRRAWLDACVAAILVALIGAADAWTGPQLTVSLFYLVPVGWMTWERGLGAGLLFAVASGLASSLAVAAGVQAPFFGAFLPYWNAGMRAAIFSVVAATLFSLRQALRREHRQRLDLEESNRALDRFTYTVSHDLQVPLRHIVLYADLLAASPALSETEDRRHAERIAHSAGRMRELVDGLLEIARARGIPAAVRPVDLNAVYRTALADLDDEIRSASATIEAAVLPVVVAVPAQMYQLFLNLLSNAVKFRRLDVPLKVAVQVSRTNDFLDIRIADNGAGIAADRVESIFRPFVRGGSAGVVGSGIGLATCRDIARRYGGDVAVSSRPGEGSVFTIRFPRAMETNGTGERRSPAAGRTLEPGART